MLKLERKAIVIGIIAGLLVICDGIISKLLGQTASFTWVAFVSWTVFFGAKTEERLKAVVGYIIGFLAAVAIIEYGNLLSIIDFKVFGLVAIGSVIATILINYLCLHLELADKFFPVSISGIFVGMAMTFSGLGIGLNPNNLENSLLMLGIIVIYGILGLLSGWATLKFGMKK